MTVGEYMVLLLSSIKVLVFTSQWLRVKVPENTSMTYPTSSTRRSSQTLAQCRYYMALGSFDLPVRIVCTNTSYLLGGLK